MAKSWISSESRAGQALSDSSPESVTAVLRCFRELSFVRPASTSRAMSPASMLPRRSRLFRSGNLANRWAPMSLILFCTSESRCSRGCSPRIFITPLDMLVLEERSSSTRFGSDLITCSTVASVITLLVSASEVSCDNPSSFPASSSFNARKLISWSFFRSVRRPNRATSSAVTGEQSPIEISVSRSPVLGA